MAGHIRIGIDTGGTFTDVVAFDETTGELTVTKTPSTPADPAQGFMAGLDKMLGLLGAGHGRGRIGQPRDHGRDQPAARRATSDGSGSSPARASSSSWRSPGSRCRTGTATPTSGSSRTGSCRPTWSRPSAGGMDHTGAEMRPFDEAQAVAVAPLVPRPRGSDARGVLPALVRQPGARGAAWRPCWPASIRRRWCRCRREVLPRVPGVRAGDDDAGGRRGEAAGVAVRGVDR